MLHLPSLGPGGDRKWVFESFADTTAAWISVPAQGREEEAVQQTSTSMPVPQGNTRQVKMHNYSNLRKENSIGTNDLTSANCCRISACRLGIATLHWNIVDGMQVNEIATTPSYQNSSTLFSTKEFYGCCTFWIRFHSSKNVDSISVYQLMLAL